MRRAVAKTVPEMEDGCVSSGSSIEVCAYCNQLKYCKKYVSQRYGVVWICKPCRKDA